MPGRVFFSTAALRDLANVVDWLTQPGSGYRAHQKIDEIWDGIDSLPDNPALYAWDRDRPDCRLAVFHGYAVRYRVRHDGSIWVERVFGPGRLR